MRKRNNCKIIFLLLPLIFIFCVPLLYAQEYSIVQLTNNTYNDYNPQIHNGQVVWYGRDGNGSDWEIFLYDGTRVTQLTNNDYDDFDPKIYNGQVVWQGYYGHDSEIFLYDGTNITQLTNNDCGDAGPQIHNGQVVWEGYDYNCCDVNVCDSEIYLYNGTKTIQLTNNTYDDYGPQIHNGQVVWKGSDGNDTEIFLYDGTNITQLTNNSYHDINPKIHNGQVVWEESDGNGYTEIYLYNGTTTTQLTHNTYNDYNPQIHNGQVVWHARDGNGSDYEIYLYDGTRVTQLTNNDYGDSGPQIHNGQVVWYSYDGYDWEIFLYDGTKTIQLTNDHDNEFNPQIHNGQVVWQAGEAYLYDIFLATPLLPKKVTISGTIRYENRIFNEVAEGESGATEFKPVRFVKVEIIRASDNTVLGTTLTQEDGRYTIEIENLLNEQVYLKCSAQQDNNDYHIVIKDNRDTVQSISSEVISGNSNSANIDVDISSDNAGGAFNIFDCLVEAIKKVKELSGSTPPPVTVYWQKGFGCTSHNDQNNIIYLNGADSNPDEYDDAVILHEYGHFIAAKYSFDKSPGGGPHFFRDTNQDIRFSWSEGWATYFSCMVRNNPLYIDVYKLPLIRQDVAYTVNLENLMDSEYGSLIDTAKGQDTEAAVAAILWDIFDYRFGDDDLLGGNNQYIWNVLDNYITQDMDCVLEDFYQGWFSQNGPDFYRSQFNNIFASCSVFYSGPDFVRGPIFTKIDGNPIPDGTGRPLNSILNISENLSIKRINVFLDLPHKYKRDLQVTLISPSGRTTVLHNRTPALSGQSQDIFAWYQPPYETIPVGSLDKFNRENSRGRWVLRVVDGINHPQMEDSGILKRWKIEVIANQAPEVGIISPSGSTSLVDQKVNFSTTYSDPDGWQDISSAYIRFNGAYSTPSVSFYYNRLTNQLYFYDPSQWRWLGGMRPGSFYVLQTPYAKLDCRNTTVSGTDKTLTVNWAISFKRTFTGKKNIYLYVRDSRWASDGWEQVGEWTIK